jgi:hypothetical protein
MAEDLNTKKRSHRGLGGWLKRIAVGLAAALALLLVTGVIYQAIGSAADARRYPPPGELVSVGQYRLHIYCTGEGSPTVILDTLHGGTSINWAFVQPEAAKVTRVCSYDRAGRGWSDQDAMPRDLWGTAEDLHTLLLNAGEQGPYVLVGHYFFPPWRRSVCFASISLWAVRSTFRICLPGSTMSWRLSGHRQNIFGAFAPSQWRRPIPRGWTCQTWATCPWG